MWDIDLKCKTAVRDVKSVLLGDEDKMVDAGRDVALMATRAKYSTTGNLRPDGSFATAYHKV